MPKEPPTDLSVKRLAVQVEDHDLEYASYEGVIPKGMYGAGKVEIWDKGEFEIKKNEKDKIEFVLKGKRLKGNYCLLRFKKAGDKQWLFFRMK